MESITTLRVVHRSPVEEPTQTEREALVTETPKDSPEAFRDTYEFYPDSAF